MGLALCRDDSDRSRFQTDAYRSKPRVEVDGGAGADFQADLVALEYVWIASDTLVNSASDYLMFHHIYI